MGLASKLAAAQQNAGAAPGGGAGGYGAPSAPPPPQQHQQSQYSQNPPPPQQQHQQSYAPPPGPPPTGARCVVVSIPSQYQYHSIPCLCVPVSPPSARSSAPRAVLTPVPDSKVDTRLPLDRLRVKVSMAQATAGDMANIQASNSKASTDSRRRASSNTASRVSSSTASKANMVSSKDSTASNKACPVSSTANSRPRTRPRPALRAEALSTRRTCSRRCSTVSRTYVAQVRLYFVQELRRVVAHDSKVSARSTLRDRST